MVIWHMAKKRMMLDPFCGTGSSSLKVLCRLQGIGIDALKKMAIGQQKKR
jgi:tRNA G10  N-methylase Trm11